MSKESTIVETNAIVHVKTDVKSDTRINITRKETIKIEKKDEIVISKVEECISSSSNLEDILERIKPVKSFLYRNPTKKITPPYLPMTVGPSRKKSFFHISSFEYPLFDISKLKYFSSEPKNELFNDRGYYSIKNTTESTYNVPKPRMRSKSQCSDEMSDPNIIQMVDEHFYEDLCYPNPSHSSRSDESHTIIKYHIAKIQEIFQSIRIPTFFKIGDKDGIKIKEVVSSKDENGDGIHVYDNVQTKQNIEKVEEQPQSAAEEYLEPMGFSSIDYCDVNSKEKDDSLVGVIMKMFETKFGKRKETTESNEKDESGDVTEVIQKWSEPERKAGAGKMADRPLPVPVESEAYYMEVDRNEASRLLQDQEDGTFILRPSSQPTHAYTLSVSCNGQVHNVGVRRRSDGRLALGFARRGERSFQSFTALLRHHRRRRLLLVTGGNTLGSTTLKDSPMYYQIPSSIPVESTVL